MISLFDSVQWYSSPPMNWTIQYEYRRNGADMQYRFYWKVWVVHQTNWYDYALNLQLFLDGSQRNVTIKDVVANDKGWSYEGTTEWYTVSQKTTGSTAFYARIYNVNTTAVLTESSTYGLTVSGAASVLGTIPNFDVDNGVRIPITKYDSSFTDILLISYGGTNFLRLPGVTDGSVVKFDSPTLSTIYNLMKTVKSGTFTFTLYTMSGSTTIGTSTKTATGSISNANPTFKSSQVSYADVASEIVAVTGNNQHIVQNKSSLTVTFGTATGNKGATISQYVITVNGVTKTATASGSVSFGAINSSNSLSLTVVAKDSRGNTTTVMKNITVLAYAPPVLDAVLERLNNYEDTTYLTAKASISSVNGKNGMTISYKSKVYGESYGSSVTISNNTQYTLTCDKNNAYVFSITVMDTIGTTVTKEFVLAKGKFPLFIDTSRNAVGINEFPQDGEALRVAGGVAMFEDGIKLINAVGEAVGVAHGIGTYTGDLNDHTTLMNTVCWVDLSSATNGPQESGYGIVETWGNGGSACVQRFTSTSRCTAKRMRVNSTWQPWEWENPPMVAGIEYRTTKRRNGEAVYTKHIDLGSVPSPGSSKRVSVDLYKDYECVGKLYSLSGGNSRPLPAYSSTGAILAWVILYDSAIELRSANSDLSASYGVSVDVSYTKP